MVAGGAVVLGIAIDLAPFEGLVVALSALVGCGRLWSPAALSHWEFGNCNRSGSVRGSGGCVVGSGRLWSAVVAGGAVSLGIAIDLAPLEGLVVALSAVVGCGRRRRCLIGNCNLAPLEGLVVALSALVGCSRLCSYGRWRLCSTTVVRRVAGELEAENWRLCSTTLVRGAICGAGS